MRTILIFVLVNVFAFSASATTIRLFVTSPMGGWAVGQSGSSTSSTSDNLHQSISKVSNEWLLFNSNATNLGTELPPEGGENILAKNIATGVYKIVESDFGTFIPTGLSKDGRYATYINGSVENACLVKDLSTGLVNWSSLPGFGNSNRCELSDDGKSMFYFLNGSVSNSWDMVQYDVAGREVKTISSLPRSGMLDRGYHPVFSSNKQSIAYTDPCGNLFLKNIASDVVTKIASSPTCEEDYGGPLFGFYPDKITSNAVYYEGDGSQSANDKKLYRYLVQQGKTEVITNQGFSDISCIDETANKIVYTLDTPNDPSSIAWKDGKVTVFVYDMNTHASKAVLTINYSEYVNHGVLSLQCASADRLYLIAADSQFSSQNFSIQIGSTQIQKNQIYEITNF